MRAYVIIPDIHGWDKNIRGRRNYRKEIKEYMKEIMELVSELSENYEVIVIFIGDIFHKGFASKKVMKEYDYWKNYFLMLNTMSQVYSVVGNHEISYYEDNPFWFLVETIESDFIRGLPNVSTTELGDISLIRVVDEINDGNVSFKFGHYTHYPRATEGKTNILLSHNSIIEDEIATVLKEKYGRDPLTNFIDHSYIRNNYPFAGYQYVFNGHMHRAYSLFTIKYDEDLPPTRLRYLGSLGRTNANEIMDTDLERAIPIIYTDGETVNVEERFITLWNREKAVNETIIEENRRKYEEQKLDRELERQLYVTADPIGDISALFKDLPFFVQSLTLASQNVRPPELDKLANIVRRGI